MFTRLAKPVAVIGLFLGALTFVAAMIGEVGYGVDAKYLQEWGLAVLFASLMLGVLAEISGKLDKS